MYIPTRTCNNSIELESYRLNVVQESVNMKKNQVAVATKEVANELAVTSTPADAKPDANPVLTAELIDKLRAAESQDEAVRLLAPDAKAKAKPDATYTL